MPDRLHSRSGLTARISTQSSSTMGVACTGTHHTTACYRQLQGFQHSQLLTFLRDDVAEGNWDTYCRSESAGAALRILLRSGFCDTGSRWSGVYRNSGRSQSGRNHGRISSGQRVRPMTETHARPTQDLRRKFHFPLSQTHRLTQTEDLRKTHAKLTQHGALAARMVGVRLGAHTLHYARSAVSPTQDLRSRSSAPQHR